LLDLSGKNILIVDDDEASLFLLQEFIEPFGASLTLVSTSEGFEKCLDGAHFHLVLLDIRLKDVSGIDLLPKIRKCWPKAFVIAQTAYANNGDDNFFINKGFDGYISKPISFDLLISLINKLLEKKS